MRTLIIGADDVRRLLPMAACIDQMANALQAVSAEEAINPQDTPGFRLLTIWAY